MDRENGFVPFPEGKAFFLVKIRRVHTVTRVAPAKGSDVPTDRGHLHLTPARSQILHPHPDCQ